jgi:hypothetical protein
MWQRSRQLDDEPDKKKRVWLTAASQVLQGVAGMPQGFQ